jgi:hypothetical protein
MANIGLQSRLSAGRVLYPVQNDFLNTRKGKQWNRNNSLPTGQAGNGEN